MYQYSKIYICTVSKALKNVSHDFHEKFFSTLVPCKNHTKLSKSLLLWMGTRLIKYKFLVFTLCV